MQVRAAFDPPGAGHAFGHAPQWSTSLFRFASQPFTRFPSQLPQPAAHVYWQAPSVHPLETMFAGAFAAQLFPQLPQLVALVFVFVSQPLLPAFCKSPSQSP